MFDVLRLRLSGLKQDVGAAVKEGKILENEKQNSSNSKLSRALHEDPRTRTEHTLNHRRKYKKTFLKNEKRD